MTPRRVPLALCGQTVRDLVSAPGDAPVERLGGAPWFGARALARAGISAAVATRGGTAALRAPLAALGLPLTVGPSGSTFVSELEIYGDGGRRHAIGGLGDPFTPADVASWMRPALAGAAFVVAGAQWCDDFGPATLAALGAGGRRIFLDAQGPARPARTGPIELAGPLDPALVAGVAVLKCSEEEAAALLGGVDADAPARLGVGVVVVTLGHDGALVIADGTMQPVAAEPVLPLTDTIGAGDAFMALMAAAQADGADVVAAAQLACEGVAEQLRAAVSGPP